MTQTKPQARQRGTATMKGIARECGLSVPTVSQILNLNNGHRFRAATCEKVLEAARRLGYRRNSSARAMRTGRFDAVAVLCSALRAKGRIGATLLEGLEDGALQRDQHLMLGRLPDEKLTDSIEFPKVMREWMVDGLLINYHADVPPALRQIIVDHRMPSIWINVKHEADCIHPNDLEGGRDAARFLLDQGHIRIGYADLTTGPTGHYSAIDRYEGVKGALEAAGHRSKRISPAGLHLDAAARIARAIEVLEKRNRPTAVVAYNGENANAILIAAMRLGLRVPDDLRIVTFGDETAEHSSLPLDTVIVPSYQMGTKAIGMLAEKIRHPQDPLPSEALSMRLSPCPKI